MEQENTPKKIQVQERLKKMVAPCDKLTQQIFDIPANEYKDIVLKGEECLCVEGEDKKGNEVCTPYWLSLVGEYLDTKPLSSFEREVFISAVSAYEQGYRVITYSMTLNTLSGKDRNNDIHTKQFEAIKAAFDKLMFTGITIDLEPLLKAYPQYRKRHIGKYILKGLLLPSKYIDAEINGRRTLAIKLLDESPLMYIAKLKRQVLTYDITPLAIPSQNQTPTVLTIDNYLLRRIHLIERGVNPSIRLESIYRNCDISDSYSAKQNARKVIDDALNHFKAEGVIENFTWLKKDGAWYSITVIVAKSTKCNK